MNNCVINQRRDTFDKTVVKSQNANCELSRVSDSVNKRSKVFKRRPTKHMQIFTDNSKTESCSLSSVIKTRDVGTQTENDYIASNIVIMESTIRKLTEKIQILESRAKVLNTDNVMSQLSDSLHKCNNHSEEIDSENYDLDAENNEVRLKSLVSLLLECLFITYR